MLFSTKYYLDFIFINLQFVLFKYYLDSKLGKLPILSTVTVNLETSISKLGRVLFHNNSYVRFPLFFTESSALLKNGEKTLEGKCCI